MAIGENLLGGPPPTLLPADPAVEAELAAGADPDSVVRAHPESSSRGRCSPIRRGVKDGWWSHTRSLVWVITADWTRFAATAGKAMVRCRGTMSRIRDSCVALLLLDDPLMR